MLPILLNLKDRLVVVIGGGSVGRRKAANALAAGAHVRLICLESRPVDENHPNLDWQTATYAVEHLDGARLVFAAATAAVNAQVVADARARGLWVNAATDPESGDFALPAVVRRGDFLLAISTGGAAPGLAQTVRRQLEEQFDAVFGQWVALLAELRPVVLARLVSAEQRHRLFKDWCREVWLDRLRREGLEVVHAALHAELDAASLPPSHPL